VLAPWLGLLAAQDAFAQDIRLQNRLEPRTAVIISALVDSARTLDLPTEPLVQKALEGQSKGASGDAIVHAVRSLIRDLGAARAALGGDVGADVLLAAATVLDAGGTPPQLERLRPHRSREALTASLAGLAYLISRGVPAEQSADIVVAMLNARLPGKAFATLQRMVERDLMAGTPAMEAAAVRANALLRLDRPDGAGGGWRP
jgi:hypothetical protein